MLSAWYRCNDNAADTVVADASGNSFTGTAQRNTNLTSAAGIVGTAYNANGTTDYIDVANPGNFFDGLYLTICAWVYRNGAAGTAFARIIDRVYNGQFAAYINESVNCMGFAGKGSLGSIDLTVSAANTVPINTWVHCAWLINAAGVHGYIAGGLSASQAAIGTMYASTSAMRIANRVDGSNRAFKGCIDDLRLYNEALTITQIAAIYNGGLGSPLPYPWLTSQRGLLSVLRTAA